MRVILILITLIISYGSTAQICDSLTKMHHGEGTFYGGVAGSSGGNCGIPVPLDDTLHCGLNNIDYDTANACGACIQIWGPKGDVVVKVVDRCPECKEGDIDMTPQAFFQLAEDRDGRVDISWKFVECPVQNIKLFYKEGSSQYWAGVQFRDIKYPIKKFEYLNEVTGEYTEIKREMYNFWVNPTGFDVDKSTAGPYNFRIEDYNNQVLVLNDIPFQANGELDLGVQFPDVLCEDCAGVVGGTAELDNCGNCTGGTTGVEKNEFCFKDCAGYWDGYAYIDDCGTCVSGRTGRTPCGRDCNGDLGGSAYIDNCGNCVGGYYTGLLPCEKDCNNEWGGTATIDNCNVCSGGSTGLTIDECITSAEHNDVQINFWPNPANDVISFDSETSFVIVDIAGEVIAENTAHSFDSSTLNPGIYFLKFNGKLHKLIIEH